jgi:hypothetical protein
MKKVILAVAIMFSCLLYKSADAQISFSLNIGSQPEWGPVGYDHASYYYMPDIDSYYDVSNHQYVYYNNRTWTRSATLPAKYANYNVYTGYKAVVNERNPWERNNVYKAKYAQYKGRRDQKVIRDSRDNRYKNHWKGNNGRPGNNNDHGRGNGHDNGRGNGHGKH